MTCEKCVGFIRFFVRTIEDGRTDLIGRVICYDLMTRVQNNQIDGAEARRIMEERYGKEKFAEVLRKAEEAGLI